MGKKDSPTRAVAPLPRGGGRPGKAVEQDEDLDADGNRKKANNTESDVPAGDLESLTLGEFNRWIITERNWDVAEECREQHIEGEQQRKARDDRHRERGQLRQQDTVEQMKEAKTKVDAHRRANLEQGSMVKRDVIAWREAALELKAEWAKYGASIRQQQQAVSSSEVRESLQAEKTQKGLNVKQEVAGLTATGEKQREDTLAKNKEQVQRVKKETADEVTDAAKAVYFAQRKSTAKSCEEAKLSWTEERKQKREEFYGKVQRLMEASRAARAAASNAKRELLTQRQREAATLKAAKTELDDKRQKQLEGTAAQIKQSVNDRVSERFVQPEATRRMVQHPHYAEITAVATDVTSAISREIAAAPKRLRRGAPSPAGNSASLMMGGKN